MLISSASREAAELFVIPATSPSIAAISFPGIFIAFAIALASFIVGMVLFLAEEETLPPDNEVVNPGDGVVPPEEEEFEATDYQKEALRELIAYVEASKLQSVAKVRGRHQVIDKLVAMTVEYCGAHKKYNLAVVPRSPKILIV